MAASWILTCLLHCHAASGQICSDFACPPGFFLREERLSLDADESCCAVAERDTVQFLVQSAAFSDGSRASFKLDGQLLYETRSTGLTVMVVRRTGSAVERNALQEVRTFNTMKNSTALEVYLDSLTNGTMVLMAVADSACCRLSGAAKGKIEEFGASLIRGLKFRSAYALVGIKGGSKIVEDLKQPGEGPVAVLAELPEADDMQRPVCEAVAAPAVSGRLVKNRLVLDAGCKHRLWDQEAIGNNLAGAWVVMNGGSNMLLMLNTLVMMLAPQESQMFLQIWGSYVIDVIIEGGEITMFNTISTRKSACQHVQHNLSSHDECKNYVAARLADVPAHSQSQTRLTMFLNQFWHAVPWTADILQEDAGWSNARLAFVVQISQWYVICNTVKFEGCRREDLKNTSEEMALQLFEDEMTSALDHLQTFCSTRAELGCIVGTRAWTAAGGTLGASLERFDAVLSSAMLARTSSTLRYFDFFSLGAAMPEETISGHGSPVTHAWAWQIIFGGFFDDQRAEMTQGLVFSGRLCSAVNSNLQSCQNYVEWCSRWDSCNLWMCMNSEPCQPVASTGEFHGVNGGINRACTAADSAVSIAGLESCKAECIKMPACRGISYHANSYQCEVLLGQVVNITESPNSTCLSFEPAVMTSSMPPTSSLTTEDISTTEAATTTLTTSSRSDTTSLSLQPPSTRWDAHYGLNCYEGFGGTELAQLPGTFTRRECQAECMDRSRCEGVIMRSGWTDGASPCWLVSNVQVQNCQEYPDYDFWHRIDSPSVISTTVFTSSSTSQPSQSMAWDHHEGINCYEGFGGTSMGQLDGTFTLADCKAACLDRSGCNGIVMRSGWTDGTSPCWLVGDIRIHDCQVYPDYDVWHYTASVEVPSMVQAQRHFRLRRARASLLDASRGLGFVQGTSTISRTSPSQPNADHCDDVEGGIRHELGMVREEGIRQ